MSKLSRLSSGKSITPGMQIVETISAPSADGNAAKVLRSIAKSACGSRLSCSFPSDWEQQNGMLINQGVVTFGKINYSITLKIGARDGLVIEDARGESKSLKPTNGRLVLRIGESVPSCQIDKYARALVACWVVHGRYWKDRRNKLIKSPYGPDPKNSMPDRFFFNIIDGAKEAKKTIADLIASGCTRSTHVGEWTKRHSTIIPAVCGMPITLHEFKATGHDVCVFNGLTIGQTPEIWGGYCRWNNTLRGHSSLGVWKDLAIEAVSPFAFHIHATKLLFPGTRLDSDFILETLGHKTIQAILSEMVVREPERFYRLIDQNGLTHRLTIVEEDSLVFGNYGLFPRSQIVENVLNSLTDLQLVQFNCRHQLAKTPRVVIDSHAYLVIEALAMRQKNVYALSGRDMHRYLTEAGIAESHKIRNERLFILLRKYFPVNSVDFYIYPPLSIDSGLTSQYSESLFDQKDYWLTCQV